MSERGKPPGEDAESRYSLSKSEFRDVIRRLRPDVTDEEFDLAWEEFHEQYMRRRRSN